MSNILSFEQLVKMLGCSENDPQIRKIFEPDMLNIDRDEYYGILEFRAEGLEVVFKEAPWVVPPEKVNNPKELFVAAFHLYSEDYEGFAGYRGQLPNGVLIGDSEAELLRKMGAPTKIGGGGISSVLKRPTPRWFWFALGEAILHFELDSEGRINMATLQSGFTAVIESKETKTTNSVPRLLN